MDRFVLIGIKDFQCSSPSLFLATGNLAKIENRLLRHAAVGDASVLNDTVVAMQCTALFPFVTPEKHSVIVSDGLLASIP